MIADDGAASLPDGLRAGTFITAHLISRRNSGGALFVRGEGQSRCSPGGRRRRFDPRGRGEVQRRKGFRHGQGGRSGSRCDGRPDVGPWRVRGLQGGRRRARNRHGQDEGDPSAGEGGGDDRHATRRGQEPPRGDGRKHDPADGPRGHRGDERPEGPEPQFAREGRRPDGLRQAIRASESISDHIALKASPEGFEVVSEGDTDNVSHMVPKDLLEEIQAKEAVRSLFPLDYFSNMVKAISSAPNVTLYLGSDYPVKMEFKIAGGKGEVKFLLAPRIESDG